MAEKRISRKEIKKPDEFVTLWIRVFEYFQSHLKVFLFSAIGILVLGIAVWSGIAYLEKRERDASEMLAQAQSLLVAQDAPSPEGKQDVKKQDQDKAQEILSDLVARYKRSVAGRLARVLLGNIYFQRQEYEKAIQTYQSALKSTSGNPLLPALACEGLGYTYEATHDYGQALIYYQRLADSETDYMRGWGLLGVARCHELQNDPGKALDAYRKLLATYPQHPKAEEARSHMARLSSLTSSPQAPLTEAPAEGQGGSRDDQPK